MAPRSRASRAFPKTLTGVLAAIALAVLAALGIKTDWFHGKLSAPPMERQTTAKTALPPATCRTPQARSSRRSAHCTNRFIPITA